MIGMSGMTTASLTQKMGTAKTQPGSTQEHLPGYVRNMPYVSLICITAFTV